MIKINCMMLMETWSILLGGKWTSSSSSAGSPTSSPSSSQSSTTPFIRVHRWRPWTLNLLSMSSVVDGTSGTVHAVDMVNFNLKYLQIYSKNFRFEKLKLWEWCNENENYKFVIVKKKHYFSSSIDLSVHLICNWPCLKSKYIYFYQWSKKLSTLYKMLNLLSIV